MGDLSQYGEVMVHHLTTSCHIHRPFPQTWLKTAPHIMKLKFWYNSLVHINVKICKNETGSLHTADHTWSRLTRKTYLKFLADSEFSVHPLFHISDSNSFFLNGSYSNTVYINSTEMMVLFKFKFAVRN